MRWTPLCQRFDRRGTYGQSRTVLTGRKPPEAIASSDLRVSCHQLHGLEVDIRRDRTLAFVPKDITESGYQGTISPKLIELKKVGHLSASRPRLIICCTTTTATPPLAAEIHPLAYTANL